MARNPYYDGPPSDHYDGTRFFVAGAPSPDKSVRQLWRFTRERSSPWPTLAALPPARPDSDVGPGALRVTSIGHASHLVQIDGLNLLIDPVWSERASPLSFAGPKRAVPPGIRLDDLPPLDAVLVTHNHYDHLDLATLDRLNEPQRWRSNVARFIVPLGNDTILQHHDRALQAEAYDWNERVVLSARVSVTLLPSLHWSARGVRDRRMALWAALMIEAPGGPMYHIGDTAFGDGTLFATAARRFGAPRLAILPIGAYEPRWFMRSQHIDPDEAVSIMTMMGAHHALAHHWGCFKLTTEPFDDPPRRLAAALATAGISADRFRVQQPGGVFDVPTID